MSKLEDLVSTNISFAMQMWAEEKPKEKVEIKDFAKHFVERRNGILNLYTKRTLDGVEAYISKRERKLLEKIELELLLFTGRHDTAMRDEALEIVAKVKLNLGDK